MPGTYFLVNDLFVFGLVRDDFTSHYGTHFGRDSFRRRDEIHLFLLEFLTSPHAHAENLLFWLCLLVWRGFDFAVRADHYFQFVVFFV